MNFESIVRAVVEFRNNTYGKEPNVIRMHPRTYEQLRLTAEYGSTMYFVFNSQVPVTHIYGMRVVEDTSIPVDEARIALEQDVKVYITPKR